MVLLSFQKNSHKIEFEIQLTPLALEMLENIKDKRHQKVLSSRIDKLKFDFTKIR
ncbi:hypothetical protein GXM_05144 [Nostoc sphaeroides CCNUC1]|uniref:Uncharacterized protein n=1 Tax=Nostoc sphaeroides CCNUC1 TaxID=2653204 RepID=A0A5P8W4W6_9NOSO|nr:hypothetical protein GXM_05144 [Nostoc sphaeroides CCNUC1]